MCVNVDEIGELLDAVDVGQNEVTVRSTVYSSDSSANVCMKRLMSLTSVISRVTLNSTCPVSSHRIYAPALTLSL